MGKFIIEGGNKINGSVKVDRAKNALLAIISATVIVDGKCFLEDFPRYTDTDTMLEIIRSMGGNYKFINGGVSIDTSGISTGVFPFDLYKNIRASVFMLGAVVSRMGKAEAMLPGGCKIGERPIDIHLSALMQLGVEIKEDGDRIFLRCDRMKGAEIIMPFPSVGATENVIISASVADGVTVIKNAAREPEVKDLADFLNACGAKIKGAGSSTVVIEGVKKLKGSSYLSIPDRIESGTFAIATLLLGGEIEILGGTCQNILSIMNKTQNSACKIYSFSDKIYIKGSGRPSPAEKITAMPYPGFPTDLQPQTVALLSSANGRSELTDNVFPSRFAYVEQMKKLGADITVKGNTAIINGVNKLVGAKVFAEDLRGGAGLMLSCFKAEGESVLFGAEHIDRGYSSIENKFSGLGLKIARLSD